MASLPGGFPSDLRRSSQYPPLSSLSPLAAPFTAGGGRPLASDPIHNPTTSLGPTAPTMLQSSQRQMSIPAADRFTFSSGSDGVGAGVAPYYQPYEPWKPSWSPDVSDDGSASWIDPSQSYPVSTMDKGSASSIAFKQYEQTQIPPSGRHTNPLPKTSRIVPEVSPWKRARDPSFYSPSPTLVKEPYASPSSDAGPTDPFSTGFRSSVVGPMLRELSDSFSLDAGSTKGGYHPGLPYDKYMTQLESCSTLSPTDPAPFGPAGGLGVVGPTDSLPNCTSGGFSSSMHYGNPCRINLDYFDYLPHDQKDPVPPLSNSRNRTTKVTITAPSVANPPTIKGSRELEVKCRSENNAKPEQPGICFDAILDSSVLEALDQHSVSLDSPCWKGMPSYSQYAFSKGHTGNSCNNVPLENEISTGNLLRSEEKARDDEKTNQNFEAENEEEPVPADNNVKDDSAGPQEDVKLIIKSMHDLSQALLTSCGDDFELKGNELELLQTAMENLKSFSGRRNKLNSDDGGPASSSKMPEQINAGMDNGKSSNEATGNQMDASTQHGNTNYKKSVLEALEKIPGDDPEVEVELYKNLWIEAEVSLCTMKYELQLARTKLKMESQKHAREASGCSFCDTKPPSDSMQQLGATTALPKETLVEEKDIEEGTSVADPAVMARFNLIKGRTNNNNTESQEDHDEVDSDVMARLRILQRRGDVAINSDSVFPNYYSLGFARDSSSEWEHVLRDELLPSGNNPLNG